MIFHTSLYASILAIIFIFLSIKIIKIRQANKISLGDAQNQELIRAIRAHSNFIEYVPLALILIFLLEISGLHYHIIHILGASLVVGRIFHAFAISNINEKLKYRVVGTLMTFTTILIAAITLLVKYFIILF